MMPHKLTNPLSNQSMRVCAVLQGSWERREVRSSSPICSSRASRSSSANCRICRGPTLTGEPRSYSPLLYSTAALEPVKKQNGLNGRLGGIGEFGKWCRCTKFIILHSENSRQWNQNRPPALIATFIRCLLNSLIQRANSDLRGGTEKEGEQKRWTITPCHTSSHHISHQPHHCGHVSPPSYSTTTHPTVSIWILQLRNKKFTVQDIWKPSGFYNTTVKAFGDIDSTLIQSQHLEHSEMVDTG